jgi:hypothetical protein
MATQSVEIDVNGPDWPLGMIAVVTPGTPVSIMSLVDPSAVNAPNQATSTPGTTTAGQFEYSPSVQQIAFLAVKAGASHGTQNNTGNVYIVRKGVQGAGNRDDYGAMVWALGPGQNLFLSSAPLERNVFSPYRYYIDADTAGDSCLVTLLIA